ncbi:predicted protein [Histoplasma capsulatum var. duboisii H88]|uniref:Predicted protein n=1 Tax=Ajellomyces capsulatus (strain H88) TaxID=544711 RepID=F0UG94_AJEC8|nr:predicted protein [Histoplasma capsulatum var. duboisii H88]
MSLWADIATIQVALDVANSPSDGGELKAVRRKEVATLSDSVGGFGLVRPLYYQHGAAPPSLKKVCSTSDNSPQLLSSSYPTTTSIPLDPTSTLRPARSVAVYHPISGFPVSTFWPCVCLCVSFPSSFPSPDQRSRQCLHFIEAVSQQRSPLPSAVPSNPATLESLNSSSSTTVKLAGLNYTNFSFIHPLLGPKFRVFSGGDTRPP